MLPLPDRTFTEQRYSEGGNRFRSLRSIRKMENIPGFCWFLLVFRFQKLGNL
jgi:hypothetical protein